VEKNVAEYDPDAEDATGGLGGTDASLDPAGDAAGLRSTLGQYRALAAQRQALYDRVAKQLEERRAGPSASERLYQLGAAMMAPTTVRGFSGTMGNILPVLQQQAQSRREEGTRREDALNALQLQQLTAQEGLTDRELKTRIVMAKLQAADGKPTYQVVPPGGSLVNTKELANLPLLTPEQVIAASQDPANYGRRFRTVDNRVGTINPAGNSTGSM